MVLMFGKGHHKGAFVLRLWCALRAGRCSALLRSLCCLDGEVSVSLGGGIRASGCIRVTTLGHDVDHVVGYVIVRRGSARAGQRLGAAIRPSRPSSGAPRCEEEDAMMRAKLNNTIWRSMCLALGTDPVRGATPSSARMIEAAGRVAVGASGEAVYGYTPLA